MRCELCHEDIGKTMVLLPITKQDGCLNTISCLRCARNSSAYCTKHNKSHLGFDDGTTACVLCVEEMVAGCANLSNDIFAQLKTLPDDEYERLMQYVYGLRRITRNSEEVCILRLIAIKALRVKHNLMFVVNEVVARRSVEYILGSPFKD